MKIRFENKQLKYQYRGWPWIMPTVNSHKYDDFNFPKEFEGKEATYAIVGSDLLNGGGGVLEWCYSEQDALWLYKKMKQFPKQFSDLTIKTTEEAKNSGLDYL